eukprot:121167-Hanusia_phi.AAC.1
MPAGSPPPHPTGGNRFKSKGSNFKSQVRTRGSDLWSPGKFNHYRVHGGPGASEAAAGPQATRVGTSPGRRSDSNTG